MATFRCENLTPYTNLTNHEVHSVIQFLNMKNVHLAEIHRQFTEVYEEDVMKMGMCVSTTCTLICRH
jgi:hypothetical protein